MQTIFRARMRFFPADPDRVRDADFGRLIAGKMLQMSQFCGAEERILQLLHGLSFIALAGRCGQENSRTDILLPLSSCRNPF